MNPALKPGVACFGQSDGTQIRRGGSSFFIRDARLTPYIAQILRQIDGSRPVEAIAADLPPQLGKLFDACLGQLTSSAMLTSGTVSAVQSAFPGLAIALRFRDFTAEWHACTSAWTQTRVGIGGSAVPSGLITALTASGAQQVTAFAVNELCQAELDCRIWLLEDYVQWDGASRDYCERHPGRCVVVLSAAGKCAILRNCVPSGADLRQLQTRLQAEPGAPSVAAQLIRDAHIAYEVALQCAERHGAIATIEPELRVVEVNGTVRSHAFLPYLAGGASKPAAMKDRDRHRAATAPAYCSDWFSPSGPLVVAAVTAAMRFPLAHAAISTSPVSPSPDGDAGTHVIAWGLDAAQAERNAIEDAIIAQTPRPQAVSGKRFWACAVDEDAETAGRAAAAEVYIRWLLAEHQGLLSGSALVDRQQLSADPQVLWRLVTHLHKTAPVLRSFAIAGTASVIVWAERDASCTVGIGADLNLAAQQALGDMVSALQLDRPTSRQQTQLYRQLQQVQPAADLVQDTGIPPPTPPEMAYETVWQARAPHAATKRLASYVACWM